MKAEPAKEKRHSFIDDAMFSGEKIDTTEKRAVSGFIRQQIKMSLEPRRLNVSGNAEPRLP